MFDGNINESPLLDASRFEIGDGDDIEMLEELDTEMHPLVLQQHSQKADSVSSSVILGLSKKEK